MAQETIAIIPARGGSKRCPGKNTALFKGMPLVAHSIEQALATELFDKIIVSSDDAQVIEIASTYNVILNERESSLATDETPLIEVIRSLILKYDFAKEDMISLLLVTAPLRLIEDIHEAHKIFSLSNKKNAVVSVALNESPVQLAWLIHGTYLKPFFNDRKNGSTRKQDFEPTYRYNDAVIFDLAGNYMNSNRNLFGEKPIPYVMPPERSINIDYEFQLKLVQMLGDYYGK